jgi:hypothetical protein
LPTVSRLAWRVAVFFGLAASANDVKSLAACADRFLNLLLRDRVTP